MPFPPPPTDTIDWADVGFKVREVNGHVECKYSKTTGKWTEPTFVEDPFLRIHGMAPGLNYGMQCYEGQKAFRTPTGAITIFRPSRNATRMEHSASTISMPCPPPALFTRCVHLAVALNAAFVPPHASAAAMYIRPLLFGSSAQLGLSPPDEYTFVVYVMPTGVYHGLHPVAALILEDFDRAAPKGTGSAKVGGNYAPVLRFSEAARNDGFGITLHLDSRTQSEVDEFSTSGFVGILGDASKDGAEVTLVVPDSSQIIDSVTSDSVCRIAERVFGWKVEKRSVKYEELGRFSEVVAVGTAAALVPIKSITHRGRGDNFSYKPGAGGEDEPGAACVKLLDALRGIQLGKIEDPFGWCEVVQEPEGYTDVADKAKTNGVDAESVSKLP